MSSGTPTKQASRPSALAWVAGASSWPARRSAASRCRRAAGSEPWSFHASGHPALRAVCPLTGSARRSGSSTKATTKSGSGSLSGPGKVCTAACSAAASTSRSGLYRSAALQPPMRCTASATPSIVRRPSTVRQGGASFWTTSAPGGCPRLLAPSRPRSGALRCGLAGARAAALAPARGTGVRGPFVLMLRRGSAPVAVARPGQLVAYRGIHRVESDEPCLHQRE